MANSSSASISPLGGRSSQIVAPAAAASASTHALPSAVRESASAASFRTPGWWMPKNCVPGQRPMSQVMRKWS